MPKELPGFYYDAEKNRYFPLKGPIPGSASASSRASSSSSAANAQKPSSSTKDAQDRKASMRCRARKASKLIHARELNGNAIITSKKGKHTFMQQFLELHASQPQVWKYENTKMVGDGALEQTRTSIQTPEGVEEGDVLITGSINGSLSLFEVGKVGERFVNGVKCIPDRVWPFSKEGRAESSKPPLSLWRSALASIHWSSAISCIKLCGEYSAHTDDSLNVQKALYPAPVSDFISVSYLGIKQMMFSKWSLPKVLSNGFI
ncbi:hypothetical protein Tsubulata_045152 [Turnera subulata]|uniref:Uncharacterized protein n=1 Tax=Turnera subulata TaxID=218843 RepID=A0A9Q0FRN9_9ROSI|nr:hypothetical protein Tsubulata_045152 [Turnera subulata]